MKNKSTKKEIYIFRKFAKLCPYSTDLRSIIKKEPLEPDISCSLSDGSIIAFELTEIVDEDLIRLFSDSIRLKEAFNDELEKLEANFNNALIYIAFTEGILFRRKKNSIQKIIYYLLTLDKTTEGVFRPKDLIDIVKFITISRGVMGPVIDVESFAWIDDPCKEYIKKSLKKNMKQNQIILSFLFIMSYNQKNPRTF